MQYPAALRVHRPVSRRNCRPGWQIHLQVLLKRLNLQADRGLAEVQALSRLGDAARLRRMAESPQLTMLVQMVRIRACHYLFCVSFE